MKVKIPEDVRPNATILRYAKVGDVFEAHNVHQTGGYFGRCFYIFVDDEETAFCLENECAWLGDVDWIVIEDE